MQSQNNGPNADIVAELKIQSNILRRMERGINPRPQLKHTAMLKIVFSQPVVVTDEDPTKPVIGKEGDEFGHGTTPIGESILATAVPYFDDGETANEDAVVSKHVWTIDEPLASLHENPDGTALLVGASLGRVKIMCKAEVVDEDGTLGPIQGSHFLVVTDPLTKEQADARDSAARDALDAERLKAERLLSREFRFI